MTDPLPPPGVDTGVPRTLGQKAWLALRIIVALLVVAVLVGLAFLRTWPPLNVVMSGSMEPTIDTGDVVIMQRLNRPAEVGDIVKVRPPQDIQDRLNYPDSVIHRIVRISEDGKVFTKGDARDKRDPFTVPLDEVNARVVGEVPGVGQIVAFFTSPLGLIWLVAGVLLFILIPYFELRRDQVELEKAELGSVASLRMELHQVAQRLEGEGGGGSRAPPAEPAPPGLPAAVPAPDIEGQATEVDPGAAEPGDEVDLETELEEMKKTMGELVGAVGEYGEHLRSHTEVLKGMSAASQDLSQTVAALRATLPGAAAGAAAAAAAAGDEQGAEDAERVLARWRQRRAEEIAGWMGFRDPDAGARLAALEGVTDDEGIEAALQALAAEKPYMRPQ